MLLFLLVVLLCLNKMSSSLCCYSCLWCSFVLSVTTVRSVCFIPDPHLVLVWCIFNPLKVLQTFPHWHFNSAIVNSQNPLYYPRYSCISLLGLSPFPSLGKPWEYRLFCSQKWCPSKGTVYCVFQSSLDVIWLSRCHKYLFDVSLSFCNCLIEYNYFNWKNQKFL